MATIKHQNPAKAEAWKKHLADWKKGGLRVAEFCRQRGLKIHHFYDWRTRLNKGEHAGKAFVPIRVVPPAAPACEFVLGGRLVLRLTGPVDVERLAAVAKALQAAGC